MKIPVSDPPNHTGNNIVEGFGVRCSSLSLITNTECVKSISRKWSHWIMLQLCRIALHCPVIIFNCIGPISDVPLEVLRRWHSSMVFGPNQVESIVLPLSSIILQWFEILLIPFTKHSREIFMGKLPPPPLWILVSTLSQSIVQPSFSSFPPPFLSYMGVVSKTQPPPPISNCGTKMISFKCAPIVLDFVVIILNRTCLVLEIL